MNRRFLFGLAVLMAPAGDDGAAAGGPPAPVAGAGGPPAADPPATPPAPAAKPSGAAAALAAVQAARAEAKAKREAAAKPAAAPGAPAPAVDPELQTAADKWRSHVKTESARIATEAEGLDPEDKALIDGEPDIARKAALLARFKREAAPANAKPPKVVAPAKPAGGPPSSSLMDFEAAWAGGPDAWNQAKARDPEGAAKWLTARGSSPSTAKTNPFSSLFTRKPSKG